VFQLIYAAFAVHFLLVHTALMAPQFFSGAFCGVRIYLHPLGCRLPPLASIFWELRSSNSTTCLCYLCFSALGSLLVSSSSHDFVMAVSVAALCDI
jgi:hypothetical protein